MKITALLFISIHTLVLVQTGEIIYLVESTLKADTERRKKIHEELDLMSFSLAFNTDKSFFSKEKNIPKNAYVSRISNILSGYLGSYNQYAKSKTAYYSDNIKNDYYQVEESFKLKDWQLTNETVKINNYTCYKAILTQYNSRSEEYYNVVAWYTPEIPVSFGPIGYGGLPGLILQFRI